MAKRDELFPGLELLRRLHGPESLEKVCSLAGTKSPDKLDEVGHVGMHHAQVDVHPDLVGAVDEFDRQSL